MSPARAAALIAVFIVMVLAPGARAQVLSTAVASNSGTTRRRSGDRHRAGRDRPAGRPLDGRSTSARNITRVSLTMPDVADAMVTAPAAAADPRQDARHDLDVRLGPRRRASSATRSTCARPERAASQQMKQLFPGEPIAVPGNGKDVVISGTVSSKYVDRQGGRRRRRLRREEGRRRQPAEAAGRRGVQPGAAARALRRSEPQRDAASSARTIFANGVRRAAAGSAARRPTRLAAPEFGRRASSCSATS